MSTIQFKVAGQGSDGLFVLENTFHAKGGPARHLHYDQDEWFYVVVGEFLMEVGNERFALHPGDALLAPRNVSHVWAYVGDATGRILVTFMPAGKMEAFFREMTKANAMLPLDPDLWRARTAWSFLGHRSPSSETARMGRPEYRASLPALRSLLHY